MLTELQLYSRNYNSHSLHIGAAKTAAKAGIPERCMKMLSRWQSNACFRIGFATPANLHVAKRNMSSATDHPTVVEDYLQAELDHNQIFGPFAHSQCQSVHVSRFGVIPKRHQTNKWCLIVDLSHPADHSITISFQSHFVACPTLQWMTLSVLSLNMVQTHY